ncbi:MAG: hypothetical protein HDT43_09025 [Ruminococcaceae bacterium]|nr:hypothetical protein [Oscillospiraceae bacterium]
MNKFSLKNSLSCAWVEFVKWLIDARMIIVLCLCVFIYSFAVEPIKENAKLMGEPMNALEPFIAVLNSGMILLVMPLGFLTLISDFPKIDGSTVFYIFRIGKKSWLCGQIIRLFLMTAAYILSIFAASVVGVITSGFTGEEWSLVATTFASEFPEQSGNFGVQLLPENLYNQMMLPTAFVESALFVIAYLFSLGMILLAFSIAKRKTAGIVVCGLVIALGAALCSISTKLMWVFPMAHSIVWLHYTEFLREPIFPVFYSAIYFAAMIFTALIFCIALLKKFDYDIISLEVHS